MNDKTDAFLITGLVLCVALVVFGIGGLIYSTVTWEDNYRSECTAAGGKTVEIGDQFYCTGVPGLEDVDD